MSDTHSEKTKFFFLILWVFLCMKVIAMIYQLFSEIRLVKESCHLVILPLGNTTDKKILSLGLKYLDFFSGYFQQSI